MGKLTGGHLSHKVRITNPQCAALADTLLGPG
jgi:hypothetical protein